MNKEQYEKIIGYAKRIAIQRKYANLVNGLQPVEDLQAKYDASYKAIRDEFARWQQGQSTEWHVLHRAATVCYYSVQLTYQTGGHDEWGPAYASVRLYLPGWKEREVVAACDVLYWSRSSREVSKDIAFEVRLIRERIENLPPMGPPRGNRNSAAAKEGNGFTLNAYISAERSVKLKTLLAHYKRDVTTEEERRLARELLNDAIDAAFQAISEQS